MPENETQLKEFLGTAGYYRQFVPKYTDIAAPLHRASQKENVLDGRRSVKKHL